MKNYRVIFCTFGDTRLHKSLYRIKAQAIAMGVYDSIKINNQNHLSKSFRKKFKDTLNKKTRGFGYWCWKPQIILQTLLQLNEGDILQYTDVGCHLNPSAKKRLLEYIEMAKNSKSGLVLFRAPDNADPAKSHQNQEYLYSKGDIFKYFNVIGRQEIIQTNQYAAAAMFVRKDDQNINFIKRWIEVFSEDFTNIDDTPSSYPNFAGFIDHRHDQSILSIMAKLRGVEEITIDECYVADGDWSRLKNYPIWAMRDKKLDTLQRLKNRIYGLCQSLRARISK
jgi:hypothetical protein